MPHPALNRATAFAAEYGLRLPILMAPMAGACPPALASAVADAGGMGACGALLMSPEQIGDWSADFRGRSNGAFQLNTWIPDPAPARDLAQEAALRDFLGQFGPQVPDDAGDGTPPDFDAQCAAMLAAGPAVVSSIMGLYPADFVAKLKERRIRWFANVTTVAEARAAAQAGADVIIAQGGEAGGHRGAFEADQADAQTVGLFSLLPAVVDAVDVPVVATGGIADARGMAAALLLGASAVQIGTALLRSPEAGTPAVWADALGAATPEGTRTTRAFSGRLGRALATDFVQKSAGPDAPAPAPYPVQRGLTGPMRTEAAKNGELANMQAWAGQSAGLSRADPAAQIVTDLWAGTCDLLSG